MEELVREFESQTDGISLALRSKGNYRGTLDATLNAAENGDPPAIPQIFEIRTARARESGFTPVEELLSAARIDSLLDPMTNYYRFDGTLYSLPFNAANPVVAYNRDAFREAGLDPDSPPEALTGVRSAAEQLVDGSGVDAGITFANYSWFVEQWFAEADQLLVDRDNGRSGPPTGSSGTPHYRTAFDRLIETRDTTATWGAQIGPFDTVRTIIEDAVDSMDGPGLVPTALDRLDAQVGKQLGRYDSGR